MRPTLSSKLRAGLLALATVVTVVGVAAPALAEERHDWHRDRHEQHWRGHRDWDRGGVYVAPSYGYYDGYYAYPPPVVYPSPGLSITIPIR